MKQIALIVLPAFVLSACDQVPLFDNLSDRPWLKPAPVSSPETAETLPESEDIEVAALPSLDPEAPRPEPTSSGFLGKTVVTLGDATRDGFWLETPLVDAPAKGKVRYPASGREVKVDLIPRAGAVSAGSSLSLGAMRLLNVPLTGLAEVEVSQL